MCRGLNIFIHYNSVATHQKIDCHHQLLLFTITIFICCCKDVGYFIKKKIFC